MKYSLPLRAKILALHEQGLSDNLISKIVGKRQGAVSRFLRTFCGRTSLVDSRGRGRPRTLTTKDEHIVKHLILSGECRTAAEVARQAPNLGLPAVSVNTIRNALRRQGLVARVKFPKPFLTKAHMRRRLAWARAHRYWTMTDWRRVLFSDETKLLCVNARGRSWCWREPGPQPLCARAVMPSKKFGGGSILLWGCMSANGVGNLCRIFVNMTGTVYTEILERHMLPSTAWLLPRGCTDFILQQNNDPKHTSRRAHRWLEANHVATLPGRPNRPT